MAKKKQSGRRVEGWKAKSWYKVFAPEVLGKTYIGDTIANDPESVVGRILQTTLGEIINDYARQNVKMKFKIANVAGDSAYTEFVGHEITRDYLRSMIKRRTSRIDCHVPVTTKDGKRVDLTVTCFTLTRANLSQAHEIRSIISSMISKMGSEADMNGIISGIVNGDFSREVFKAVKPVFPVRRVEVIKSKLTTAKVV
ncbi:MAG TPA: 30S ribosomal protein S3ae [Methanolinea sp.]|jgi:small subunit ribosomal protein S3Ae|nr:30S ribosomal protein S3ae [Methanolinea sp.]HOS81867.1 30S ribosomal protein S3ae [Methanolinea sp.]HPC55923.1 30S ribosomal protein S3ae [Methanolinea sp.]HQE85487.1 30S ribosomal protein S3ae [Methanolinea sp.]HQI14339.1 30S ribosomal protein S3ae [Methanolinea sp.]